MSELTDKVRRMLAQAQVFARDTPFEAVARTRQAVEEVDAALATCPSAERPELEALRQVAASRVAHYERRLAAWSEDIRTRAARYNAHEREYLGGPLRAKGS